MTGADEARISQSGAFGNFREPARLVRNAQGAVTEVRLAGGRLIAEANLAAELTDRYGR